MQAIGNGILLPGDASITLGTGGQIFVPTDRPDYDPKLRTHTFCHVLPDTWYVMGATLNCCLAQNWFVESILQDKNVGALHASAADVPIGSRGLYFLPYLTGERTPHMNPEARGIFFGLTLSHTREDLTRAVIEGISYTLLDAMSCIKAPVHRLILSGGGARSTLWRQIVADMMNQPIYTSNMKEQAGIGAAICAMVGTKAYMGIHEACSNIIRISAEPIKPIPDKVAYYQDHLPVFREIYRRNVDLFQACNQ